MLATTSFFVDESPRSFRGLVANHGKVGFTRFLLSLSLSCPFMDAPYTVFVVVVVAAITLLFWIIMVVERRGLSPEGDY